MDIDSDDVGPAVVLEAVLHTDQLADIRNMLQIRLQVAGDPGLWQVVTATNELVTNALVHGGRCVGLRVYWTAPVARVEVDDPSPLRVASARRGRGLRIVEDLSTAWGDEPADRSWTDGGPPGRQAAAKTVWCEIDTSRSFGPRRRARDISRAVGTSDVPRSGRSG